MKRFLLILLIFVLLCVAGCIAAPSPTAAPTHTRPASPTPTITPVKIEIKASIFQSTQEVTDSFIGVLSEEELAGIDIEKGIGFFTINVSGGEADSDTNFALYQEISAMGSGYRMVMETESVWKPLEIGTGEVQDSDEIIITASIGGKRVLSWDNRPELTSIFYAPLGSDENQEPFEIELNRDIPNFSETKLAELAKPAVELAEKERKEAEIRQNIELFLNEEGIYSDEALENEIFIPDQGEPGPKEHGLGLIQCMSGVGSTLQGILLGVLPGPNGEFVHVFFGTEDENDQRIVVPVRIMQKKGFEQHLPLYVQLYEGREFSWDEIENEIINDPENVIASLEVLIGKPVMIQLLATNKYRDLVISNYIENGALPNEATTFYNEVFKIHLVDQAKALIKISQKRTSFCKAINTSKYPDYAGIIITKDNVLTIDFEDIFEDENYTLVQLFKARK